MDTLTGVEGDFAVSPEGEVEPVKGMQDGCDVFMFSHQDPALDVLELQEALVRDPDREVCCSSPAWTQSGYFHLHVCVRQQNMSINIKFNFVKIYIDLFEDLLGSKTKSLQPCQQLIIILTMLIC